MDEKSTEKETAEGNFAMQSEEIESDEDLSASESAVITTESINEDSGKDNKLAIPQIQSDSSGIDLSSGYASASEISCEKTKSVATQEKLSDSHQHNEPTQTGLLTSASELPCKEGSDSDANKRTGPPVEFLSVPEIQREESSSTDALLSPLPSESDYMAASEMESVSKTSDVPYEQATSCTKENKAASAETSPKAKSMYDKVVGVFKSPTKFMKTKKSRSKSMSPSEKSKLNTNEESNSAPEARISSEGKENTTNKNEKGFKGFVKQVGRTFSIVKKKRTESESLVAGEETEKTEEQSTSKTEVGTEIMQPTINVPRWTNNRTSLTEFTSSGTTITDVPSTSSSSEVFSAESSRKQSSAGENECEAVASVLPGSSEVQVSNIDDNSTENESQANGPSNEEGQESAASDNIDQQRIPSKENSINDKKPEN